uniref:Influenza virus NS1A-binding protein homolog A-like n=1 Tax=Phallusia mammillata TaxID=59560 RepID=A0A6F9DGK0_9ASCI|nr:influenza virus NS1A-binding protein homolog A-like [Phallusia mammillata]
MKELVSQNFAAAKAVIPYMRQFVPNAETEFALGSMYVMCKNGDLYSCDMSALKPKTCDNNSIFIPKWVKKIGQNNALQQRDSMLIHCFQKLYALGNYALWSVNGARWQSEGQIKTHCSKAAAAIVGDTLYVAGGTNNQFNLVSYLKKWGEVQTTKLTSMKLGRSRFALIPYKDCLFAIGGIGYSIATHIEVYTIESNTWETLTVKVPDVCSVKMYLVHQNRAYIVHGNDTIQVSTFDLARRQWVTGMNAETGIVERCASLTLGFPDFAFCTMGPPLP